MVVKLVIADDHPIVLQGLEDLFAHQGDIQMMAACANGTEALNAVFRHQADVLLLDLKMEDLSGINVLGALAGSGTRCRTVILTAAARDLDVAKALDLGVSGLILKDVQPEFVVEAVRHVAQGRSWFDRETLRRALAVRRSGSNGEFPERKLTAREVELIKLVAKGLHTRAVAGKMGIAEGTVKGHLHNIYDKLGVDGRLELVLAAQQKHLV